MTTLASALGSADRDLRAAEVKVEALLTSLFEDWRGWQFHRSHDNRYSIDVYCVASNPIALRAIAAAGFTTIGLHSHPAAKFVSCRCKIVDAY